MRGLVVVLALLTMVDTSDAACRSQSLVRKFHKQTGFPHGRAGYIVDHIAPLSCGGKDIIQNLQYQTIKEGKAKDKWETTIEGCRKLCTPTLCTPKRQVFNCK